MSGLIMRGNIPFLTFGNHIFYSFRVAQDKINMVSINNQPTASINPFTPFTGRNNQIFPVFIIHKLRRLVQRYKVKCGFIVIDTDINIRFWGMSTPCTRATKHNSLNA